MFLTNGSAVYGRGSTFLCTFPFLSWTERSGSANKKPYRKTRSKLVVHNTSVDV